MGILDEAGGIAEVLAKMAANRADARVTQGDAQQRQANAEANIYRTQSDVALKGPTMSAKSAAQGDQMANIQPFSWTGDTSMSGNIPIPQSTGGLTPANFGPSTRKAGADLASLSASRVSSPAFNIPKPPVLPPLPESSGLDSILGTAGALGSLAGALGKNAGGSSIDIGKIIAAIRNRGKGGSQGPVDQPGWQGPVDEPGWQGPANEPTGSTDTGEFMGTLPDYGGTTGGTDPSQLPGGSDPMAEYLDWLAQNGNGGDVGDNTGTNWWSE